MSRSGYKNKEIDFTAWGPDGKIEFYQVALRLVDPGTLKKNSIPSKKLSPESMKILITLDRGAHDVPDDVKLINSVYWMLEV